MSDFTIKFTLVDDPAPLTPSGWEHRSWRCTVGRRTAEGKRRQFTTMFHTGMAFSEPGPRMVVSSMLLDASTADESFEDWAASFGYDTDSIKALTVYKECQKARRKMLAFFDDIGLDEANRLYGEY